MTDHSTDIATRGETTLAIRDEQDEFTEAQIAALRLGKHATPADVSVFFHICKRTGLDPFARQIHMIERKSGGYGGKPEEYTQTIQTGIDGFRLVSQRAAARDGVAIAIDAPLWAGEDGVWRELWVGDTPPVASKVTIWRDGNAFSHVAMFREYMQTFKRNGQVFPMGLWGTMPANQIAKCAEAAAHRKAFPQDTSSLYVDAEMDQANNERPAYGSARSRASRATVTLQSVQQQPVSRVPMNAALGQLFPDADPSTQDGIQVRLDFISRVLGREVTDPRVLTQDEVTAVADEAWSVVDARKAGEGHGSQQDGGEDAQPGRMFAALDALFPNLPASTEPGARERLAYMSNVLGREVNHPRELDQDDCDTVTEAAAARNVTD